jgi:DNA repair exonuclease SbcCD nuclease subunit
MANLFKKALVFTDIHYGLKSNSTQHNEDCNNFVDWAIDIAKKEKCETGFFLGDWHHNRSSINLLTLSYSLKALEKLSKTFKNFYFLPGNHDLYYKDKRDIHGAEWAKHLPNIKVINEWFQEDNVAIVPWLVKNDHKKVKKIKAKYVFGHFELPHFKMNASITMPDTGEISADDFTKVDHVFSGHFHIRQKQKNIEYIGNCFPHNYADDGDSDRGCMVLEWGKEPVYHNWEAAPLYKVIPLSTLLDKADKLLKPNMYIRVPLDIEISYEESGFIKEKFVSEYNLRELSLIPDQLSDINSTTEVNMQIQTVDEIVHEKLTNIESDTYNTNLLIQLYQDL